MKRRRILGPLMIVGLVAASCGSTAITTSTAVGTSEPTTSTVPAVTTTTDAAPPSSVGPATPSEAFAPPLSSYAEVEAEHSASVGAITTEGRAAVDQILDGEFEVLHARLDDQMTALISVDDLETGKEQLISEAPLGARIADRAFQLGPTRRAYRAEIEWGDGALAVTAIFDEAWKIASLALTPQGPLPEDPAEGYEGTADLRLPFEGLWFVFWGGDAELQNYHVVARDQRHALDLVIWKDGATFRGDGTANDDYWAFGQDVLAPAAGTVVTVVDGLPGNIPQVGTDPANAAGNHVVIRVAEAEYLLIAHMQAGSLAVSAGDTVEQGQFIGLVGNSGNSSEPHIHIHLQDRPELFLPAATGLPLVFSDYLANGEAVDRGRLVADQFISNS